jgi:hypothetical protein
LYIQFSGSGARSRGPGMTAVNGGPAVSVDEELIRVDTHGLYGGWKLAASEGKERAALGGDTGLIQERRGGSGRLGSFARRMVRGMAVCARGWR